MLSTVQKMNELLFNINTVVNNLAGVQDVRTKGTGPPLCLNLNVEFFLCQKVSTKRVFSVSVLNLSTGQHPETCRNS